LLVPYTALYALISRYIAPKSLIGIIKDCYSSFDESIETATKIEDYHYLNNMVTKKDENEAKYDFFWDYKNSLPTVIEKKVNMPIDALVSFSFDYQSTIPKKEFTDLIHAVATDRLYIDSTKYIERFNDLYDQRINLYRLEHDKIKRNESCPCGSGKKYKLCHGK